MPTGAYVGDGQAEDAFAVVIEYGQLLAILQLLLDSSYFIGDLVCSRNLHVCGEASYHKLQGAESEASVAQPMSTRTQEAQVARHQISQF